MMKNIMSNKLFLINKFLLTNSKEIITKSRNTIIFPRYLGKTILIHNGKNFVKVNIVKEMIGYKLGEFVKTRKTFKFKNK